MVHGDGCVDDVYGAGVDLLLGYMWVIAMSQYGGVSILEALAGMYRKWVF